jgi:toxin ParE1/3/4
MRVRISRPAEDDLVFIFARIAQERPSAAEAFKNAAEASFRLLGLHAEIGPRVSFRTRHKELRFWPITDFQNYVIYYVISNDEVSIERILDGRRDVPRVLRSGRA